MIRKFNFLRYLKNFLDKMSLIDIYMYILFFLLPALDLQVGNYGHVPDYVIGQVLICQKKAPRLICG